MQLKFNDVNLYIFFTLNRSEYKDLNVKLKIEEFKMGCLKY